jgi:putative ABC transport system substrate-binding protein
LTAANQELIARLAARKRLPSIFVRGEFVAKGGLMSYGPNQNECFTRVAALIDKILKEANPRKFPWNNRPSSTLL